MSDTILYTVYTVSRSYLYGHARGYAIAHTGATQIAYPTRLPAQLVRVYDVINSGLFDGIWEPPCLS